MARRPARWSDPFPALQALRALGAGLRRAAAGPRALARGLARALARVAAPLTGPWAPAGSADPRAETAKPELQPMDWRNPPSETLTAAALPLAAGAAAAAAAAYFAASWASHAAAVESGAAAGWAGGAGGAGPRAYDTAAPAVGPVALDALDGSAAAPEGGAAGGADPTLAALAPLAAGAVEPAPEPEGPDGFADGAGFVPAPDPGPGGPGGTGPSDAPTLDSGGGAPGGLAPLAPSDGPEPPLAGFPGPGAPAAGAGTDSGGDPGAGSGTGAGAGSGGGARPAGGASGSGGRPVLLSASTDGPTRFVANAGQWDPGTDFAAAGPGYRVELAPGSFTARLARPATDADRRAGRSGPATDALTVTFTGLDPAAGAGEGRLASVSHFYAGSDPAGWRAHVPEYGAVRYAGVRPGTDLVYRGADGGRVEFLFAFAAGADPEAVGFTVSGATARVDGRGRLVLTTPAGTELVQTAPVAYQDRADGGRDHRAASYRVRPDGSIGFAVAGRDPARALVVDPVLHYAASVGSAVNAVAAGPGGTVTAAGYTIHDATVWHRDAAGAAVWTAALGGANGDDAKGIARAPDGTLYVTGVTGSADFPTTLGALDTTHNGHDDAFVARLAADGTLVAATYLGGNNGDHGLAIAVDHADGQPVAVGFAHAAQMSIGPPPPPADFPITPGADQTSHYSTQTAFVTRFAPDLSTLVYSTFRTKGGPSFASGVAIDSAGHALVVGTDPVLPNGTVGFLARYTAAGALTTIAFDPASFSAVAVDDRDRVYVTGSDFTARYDTPFLAPAYSIAAPGAGIAVDALYRPIVVGGSSGSVTVTRYAADGSGADWSATWGSSFYGGTAAAAAGRRIYAGGLGGGTGVVLAYGPPDPPVVTAVADDTGVSAADRLTRDPTLTATGTARALSTVTVYRRRTAAAAPTLLGTTTADGAGNWTYALPALAADGSADGTYALTATATAGGDTSDPSAPYTLTYDTTPPGVALDVATLTYDRRPPVTIAATDLNGPPVTFALDADLNNDGDFLDAGETGFAAGTLADGAVTLDAYAPLLPVGTLRLRARATDRAGTEGAAAAVTVRVLPSAWGLTDLTPELRSGYAGAWGRTTAADGLVYAGDVSTSVALDLDLSAIACGCQSPYLVYHSQEAAPAPVVQVALQSDNALGVPASVTGTLTWDGAVVGTVSYDLSPVAPGGTWVLAHPAPAGAGTGRHTYTLDLFVDYPGTALDQTRTATGQTFVANRSASPYGAGWSFSNTDALVTVAADGSFPAGVLRLYGRGGWAFYEDLGSGQYAEPPGDAGTLQTAGGGGWTYTGWDGRVLAFDTSGRTTAWTSADGAETVTYTYDGAGAGTAARVATVAAPDGAGATFAYSGGLLAAVTAPGTRTTTFTVSGGDLTAVTDPTARTAATFAYDAAHRLTRETRAGAPTAYTYQSGLARTVQRGADAAATVTAGWATGVGAAAPGGEFGVRGGFTAGSGAHTDHWFNRFGQPVLVRDAAGGRTRLVRDADGYVTALTDPLGRTTAYEVNAAGRVTKVTDPLAGTATYAYGTKGAVTGYADPVGGLWTFTVDAFGRRLTATDALGRTTTYTYAAGLLATVTDPLGQVVTYLYDAQRRATGALSGGAPTGTTGYDAWGNASTFTDALGKTTTTVYDAAGRVLTSTDATGRTSTTTYDAFGRVLSITGPSGLVTSYAYDAAGRVEGTVTGYGTALARRTTSVYDTAGRLVATVDPLGNRTTSVYDARDRVVATVDPLGNRTTTVYDAAGHAVAVTDPLGRVTRYGYDAKGRAVTGTDPLGHTTTWVYDAADRVVATVDPLGSRATTAYDAVGNAVATVDPLGNRTTTVYDARDRAVATVDPLGNRTTTVFDVRGRVEARVDALNNRATTLYDAADRAVATVDARGNTTTTVYDDAGRVVATVDPLGNRTTTVYDAGGRYSASIDALGNRTTTVYDALDRAEATVDALGNRTTAVYDALGRTVAIIDARGNRTTAVYDALGRTVATVDALGNRATTTFDAAGNAASTTDAMGRVTSYAYDGLNRVVATTDPLGNVSSVGYDAAGRAVTMTDALGRVSTSVFDAAGRTTARIDALNNRTTWGYDAASNAVTTTDALNRVTTTIYDALNRGYVTVDALNNRTTVGFDAAGNAVSVTDARGNVSTTVYDALNRGYAQVDALGNRTTTTFDAAGNAVSMKDALGRVSTAVYDALNRGYAQIDALGNRATTTFDAAGNVRTTVDQLGRTTTYTHDARNQVVATTDARGHVWTTQYDALGRGWRMVDPLGNDTRTYFDAAGRAVETADQLGYRRSTGYDAVGNAVTSTDERGNVTTSTFDALNRVTGVQDALGNRTTAVYDAVGNVVESRDALGNRSTAVYDALNRVSASIDALGNRTTTTYDAVGNTIARVDPLGDRTTTTFDALNRVSTVRDPRNAVSTHTYDAVGNRLTLTDPVGNTTTWAYDALNRATAETDPLGNTATSAYDALGRLASATDRSGRRRDFGYDNTDNRTSEVWVASGTAVQTQTWSFDAANRMLTAQDPDGTYTFAYDARGAVTSVRQAFGLVFTMGYDAAGNRTSVTDSKGGVTTVTFDALNRQSSEATAGSGVTASRFDYAYDAGGNRTALTRYSNVSGTSVLGTTAYQYDAAHRVTAITHTSGTGSVLAALTYTLDADDRVSARADAGGTTTYAYDAADQLTADGATTFGYDANGNRTNSGYATGTGNRLSTDGVWTFTYDANGNLTKKSKGAASDTWTYGYDHRNQMTSAAFSATDGGAVTQRVTYTYDAFGVLIQRAAWDGTSTTTARYGVDGWDPAKGSPRGTEKFDAVLDLDATNAVTMRRGFGVGFDEVVTRQTAAGALGWYHTDRLGSVVQVIDNSGSVLATVAYSAYGAVVSGALLDRFGFTAQEYDPTTGLLVFNARIYDPITGRFYQTDMLGFVAGDLNLFRYVANGPTNATDPSGLDEVPSHLSNPQTHPNYLWIAKDLRRNPNVDDVTITTDGKFIVRYKGGGFSGFVALTETLDLKTASQRAAKLSSASLPSGTSSASGSVSFGINSLSGMSYSHTQGYPQTFQPIKPTIDTQLSVPDDLQLVLKITPEKKPGFWFYAGEVLNIVGNGFLFAGSCALMLAPTGVSNALGIGGASFAADQIVFSVLSIRDGKEHSSSFKRLTVDIFEGAGLTRAEAQALVNQIGTTGQILTGGYTLKKLADGTVYVYRRLKPVKPSVAKPGQPNFTPTTLEEHYAHTVMLNKPWSWAENIPGGASLTPAQRKAIKDKAIADGLVPNVQYKPGTKYLDFEKAGLVKRVDELPPHLWKAKDREQFDWLDARIPGGRPPGTTWHHSEINGRMELVPFGPHNIFNHVGGRAPGHWAHAPRS